VRLMRYLDLDAATNKPLRPPLAKKKRFPKWLKAGILTILIGALGYAAYAYLWPASASLWDLFKAPQAVLSFIRPPEEELKSTNGRTNILLLGVDYRKDMPSENLTDTMMVVSVDLKSKNKDVVMISVPRDTWVQLPQWQIGGSGKQYFYAQGAKINAANAYGDLYQYPDGAGLGLARQEIEQVLGITIHYVVRINFYGFKQVVDSVGGVTVTVDKAFTDCEYPVEGQESNPSLSQRYMCVSFKPGSQFMNGTMALEYARSRHGTNGEGSDLARAKRQQKLMVAIRDKALTLQTLSDPLKLKSLVDSLSGTFQTLDVDLGQIGAFYHLAQKVDADSAQNIVLTDDTRDPAGLLQVGNASLYGGAFVFLPRAGDGDFSEIQSYIQQQLQSATDRNATASAQGQ
jgi:LCP family protein required for cell wall assembly